MKRKLKINTTSESNSGKWIYFLRQLLISCGAWIFFMLSGMTIGTPTVLVPQLRENANSSEAVTLEEASWLPAVITYSGIPWVFLLATIAAHFGRRIAFITASFFSLIGFIMFYCSSNIFEIMISSIFHGACIGATSSILYLIITEYCSPEYRGTFLAILSTSFFWGILVGNFIGTYFHWKKIPLIGGLCLLCTLIVIYILPESPQWLATQGRFHDSTEAHRWLKGTNEKSEAELTKLLTDYQRSENRVSWQRNIINTVKNIAKIQFYKPLILTLLLKATYVFSGKLVCTVYSLDIMKQFTNDVSSAYTAMLILDCVTIVCMYVGSGLTRVCKRRSLLLVTHSISILFLFILSHYLYLVKLSLITDTPYISISLLTAFSIAIGCGPMILLATIYSEIIPIDSRCFFTCVITLIEKLIDGTFYKIFPYILSYAGAHGTFFFFCISSTICLALVYWWIPETKDKTLAEIAECIKRS